MIFISWIVLLLLAALLRAALAKHRMGSLHLSTKATLNDGKTPSGGDFLVGSTEWAEFKAKHPRMLVAFYFPRCHACQSLQPHWDEADAFLKALHPESGPLIAVDCANGIDGDLCRPYTEGFPTVRYFRDSR